jgi:hypothetical protein
MTFQLLFLHVAVFVCTHVCCDVLVVFPLQLLDNRQAEDYPLPMAVAVPLRRYQQEGINWLHFLRHFGLHGILADDMVGGGVLRCPVVCWEDLPVLP